MAVTVQWWREGIDAGSTTIGSTQGEANGCTLVLEAPDSAEATAWRVGLEGGTRLPLPPADIPESDWAAVPAIPGVDVRWQTIYTGGPFGDVLIDMTVTDGRPSLVTCRGVDGSLEPRPEAVDARFVIPLHRLIKHRLGELSTEELIAPPGGDAGGAFDSLLLIAGLADHTWTGAALTPPEVLRAISMLLGHLDGARLAPPWTE